MARVRHLRARERTAGNTHLFPADTVTLPDGEMVPSRRWAERLAAALLPNKSAESADRTPSRRRRSERSLHRAVFRGVALRCWLPVGRPPSNCNRFRPNSRAGSRPCARAAIPRRSLRRFPSTYGSVRHWSGEVVFGHGRKSTLDLQKLSAAIDLSTTFRCKLSFCRHIPVLCLSESERLH